MRHQRGGPGFCYKEKLGHFFINKPSNDMDAFGCCSRVSFGFLLHANTHNFVEQCRVLWGALGGWI